MSDAGVPTTREALDLRWITIQGADYDPPWLSCDVPRCHWDSETDPTFTASTLGITVAALVVLAEAHLDTHRPTEDPA